MVQGKDTLNDNQILPCWRWCHVPLLFLHIFLRFVLLLLLHHSGKLAIPHDHLIFLLYILNLVLFKSMQVQGELSIPVDSHVFFWWDIDGNHTYHSWGELIYHFFGTDLLQSIFDRQFQKVVLLVLKKCGEDCVVIGGSSKPFVDG